MAKKNPTWKNIKAGHTLYYIDYHIDKRGDVPPSVEAVYLHSQKTPLPPEGCHIDKMPVSHMRKIMTFQPIDKFYFSKKRALRHLRDGV